jgi:hypothetical protein
MSMRGKRKIHSISRLLKQYGFKGEKGDARKLLGKCLTIAKKNGSSNCQMIISREELGFPERTFKKWNIPDNKLIVVIEFGVIMTVKHIPETNKEDKNLDEEIEKLRKAISKKEKRFYPATA